MNNCETCQNRARCNKAIGHIFGGCNIDYRPANEALNYRLDNLEGSKDNPASAAEVQKIRPMLTHS